MTPCCLCEKDAGPDRFTRERPGKDPIHFCQDCWPGHCFGLATSGLWELQRTHDPDGRERYDRAQELLLELKETLLPTEWAFVARAAVAMVRGALPGNDLLPLWLHDLASSSSKRCLHWSPEERDSGELRLQQKAYALAALGFPGRWGKPPPQDTP